ncbi:MAG: agmatinase [Gemmatimonadota bacterium]|nr:agmatinase [Gemmatimonadota bacterium]
MNDFKGEAAVPKKLEQFPWGAPNQFLGLPPEHSNFESARVVILPVPYQATVSWMSGTKNGPSAMVNASQYVELYDHELDREPYKIGIHTLPELLLPATGPKEALEVLGNAVGSLLDEGKFVIMIGGEHSLSSPPILQHAERMGAKKLSVLQLDAHTDLRDEYDGTPFSHACVMHRVHESVDIVPVGIRSMTSEERSLAKEKNIPILFGHELETPGWIDRVMERLGPDVYITFDVDYFDPSVMPATGTPEPGGGFWYPTMQLLERVFREKNVVGCDVVELAPIPGFVAPDFLVAKLVYKMIGFRHFNS